MAFDSSKYKPKQGKYLPVLLLLDESTSMEGDKIDTLNQSTRDMIEAFAGVSNEDVEILVGVITFSSSAKIHTPFTSAKTLHSAPWIPLSASGNTAYGEALTLAYDLLSDRSNLPQNVYRPAVVTVSDGQPNDHWESPLQTFTTEGRSSKCQRFAIGIGSDVDMNVLKQFTGSDQNLFSAQDSAALRQHFSFITQTVSQRSTSVSPNTVTPLPVDSVSSASSVSLSSRTTPPAPSVPLPSQTSSPSTEEVTGLDDFQDFDEDTL